MLQLTSEEIRAAVNDALAEDVGSGDVTTLACIPADSQSTAVMTARESLLLAGLDFAVEVFLSLSPNLSVRRLAVDGHRIDPGQRVLEVSGATRPILTGERVALNFSQRLSGVATQTAAYVEAVSGTSARILDTRKTTPGWRRFEKYAVGCGGGTNHRTGLYDLVLIKDNHLAALADESPDAVAAAVTRARRLYPELKVEVEADHLGQVRQAVEAGADIILLDNMSLEDLRAAVSLVAGRAKTEASGGVTLKTVKGIAETGVDYISVGALTHSARAVDLGLDFL
ncbi:MAG TPA: carboxylating nicotinate-nucleotide diphosphorylase [Candidatus Limnocylindria bacterium]|nr:carboxylating nicotinate-nucleotide diphosphorylase [Candidatus Limnocylindria bacterium]